MRADQQILNLTSNDTALISLAYNLNPPIFDLYAVYTQA